MPRIYDGDWYLWDHNPQLGRTVWGRENGDGTTTFRSDYAVDPVVEENKAMRNMAASGWKGDYHKIASIPLNVYHDQIAEAAGQDDQKFISRWLNDSDNKAWRTKDGTV